MKLTTPSNLGRLAAALTLITLSINNIMAQTEIRNTPSGKVLLFIDGDDLRPAAGGKRLLFVDGDDIRPKPGGERLLFLDGDDIRPAPGGIRLATWDGDTLRRTPAGKILLVVEDKEIRPTAGGKLLYYLDGPTPSRAQLTAALSLLKPELFKPSAGETDAAENAIKEGQAWTAAQAKPQNDDGSYRKLAASGPMDAVEGFDLKWSGNHYAIKFQKSDLIGVGFKTEDSGWHIVGGCGQPDSTIGIFGYKDGTYSGTWFSKAGGKQQKDDSWKTDPGAEGKFASKIGALTLADAGEQLGYRNKLRLVTQDGKPAGVAYKCGNPGLGDFLVIVVGGDAKVFDFENRGGSLTGEYYGGPDAKGFFNLIN